MDKRLKCPKFNSSTIGGLAGYLLLLVVPINCEGQESPYVETRIPDEIPSDSTVEPLFSVSDYHRATLIPDRIALTLSADPSTTASVSWRSAALSKIPFGEIAIATPGPKFVKNATRVNATTSKIKFRTRTSYYHSVTFENLSPDTKYLYRVGAGQYKSEWNEFKTATENDSPFSFVYFGDAQNDIKASWSRVARRGFRDMPDAAFFLHAGDLVNAGNSDTEWGDWFFAGGWINRSIPILASPGNHEYDRIGLSRHWRRNFEFPKNGPLGLEETAYFLDYQGTRIICLNSNRDLEVQAKWLDEVLSKGDPVNWTILTSHHPFYSPAKKRNNGKLRELFAPVFAKHRIDLCLQGHDHSYARTERTILKKELGESNVSKPTSSTMNDGTVFAVSVSGPKMYSIDKKSNMVRVAEGVQLYQLISVSKERINFQARTADGKIYDQFELRKKRDRVEYVDMKPKAAEFRFPKTEK